MSNEISLNFELNKDCFLAGDQSQMVYLLIEAKPTNGQFGHSQAQLNLGLVMDRSASMKGAKIDNVKQSIFNIIDRMHEDDYLSLVAFNEEAEVIISSQPVLDKNNLKDLVDQLTHSGGTAISSGIKEGLNEIRTNLSDNKINRMILLTDGQTYGDEDDCFQLASEAAAEGILITALGVGDEWHEEVLDTIANNNNGKSDYIASPDDIIPIFGSEMKTLQNIITQNNVLRLRFTPGAQPRKICRVIPYISEMDYDSFTEQEIAVNIGELDKTEGQTLLAEIILSPKQSGRFRISQAELSYDIPSENLFEEKVRQDITAEFSSDESTCKKVNPKVMNIVETVSAYDLQTRALNQAANGDVTGATQKLRAAATRLLDMGEQDLAEAALSEAENLEQRGTMSSAGTKKLHYETRKLTRHLDL